MNRTAKCKEVREGENHVTDKDPGLGFTMPQVARRGTFTAMTRTQILLYVILVVAAKVPHRATWCIVNPSPGLAHHKQLRIHRDPPFCKQEKLRIWAQV